MMDAGTECRWCDEPAVMRREVVPAEYTAGKVLKKAAIEADVCLRHAAMIDRETRRVALEKSIRALTNRLRRWPIDSPKHNKNLSDLQKAKIELAQLERETA